MAEDFLEEIYEEANILSDLKEIVELTLYQDDHKAVLKINELVPKLNDLYKKLIEYNVEKAFLLKKTIEEVGSYFNGNLILVGDIIERRIIPLIKEYLYLKGGISVVNEEGDYLFESTDSGFLTLKNLKSNCYYHSTSDPMWEAKKMAKYIFNPKNKEYAIWGCGLGYLAYQLFIISRGSVIINIFEPDARMVEYARDYGVLTWIPQENINVVADEDILQFLYCAEKENTGVHISRQELENVPEDVKQIFNNLYMEYVTGKKFEENFKINFYRNIESNAKLISQLDISNYRKEYVVVAAGPSLDESMDFLRESKEKKTIIAVGTVFKKLIENNIIPDIVVILDPQERTYRQIEGLEKEKVPMLIGICAYWKFANAYEGDKYLIPTTQLPEIIDYCIQNKEDTWSCGGTVTSLAIEAAIRFGAEKIYLIGVDLAFPGGISHASGTMDREQKNTENMRSVEDVNGNMVYTQSNFTHYREWIESRIEETPQIIYYNMSKIGAKIKGAHKWQG